MSPETVPSPEAGEPNQETIHRYLSEDDPSRPGTPFSLTRFTEFVVDQFQQSQSTPNKTSPQDCLATIQSLYRDHLEPKLTGTKQVHGKRNRRRPIEGSSDYDQKVPSRGLIAQACQSRFLDSRAKSVIIQNTLQSRGLGNTDYFPSWDLTKDSNYLNSNSINSMHVSSTVTQWLINLKKISSNESTSPEFEPFLDWIVGYWKLNLDTAARAFDQLQTNPSH